MRYLPTAFFLSLPAAAQAMYGPGPAACGCASGPGGLLGGAAWAVVAVLGYWVLLQAVKESGVWIKRIGNALGGVLMVVGVLGMLCAVASHSKCAGSRLCAVPGGMGPGQPFAMGLMPPGHPPIGDMAPPDSGAKKVGKGR
jgi:hypothetical protein